MKEIIILIITALSVSFVLVGGIFVTGNTFGQRCSKVYKTPQEIDSCVKRLSKGEGI